MGVVGAFVALTACSNYGEGDRCEVGNGNDDCQDGLQCTPAARLAVTSSSDRCCPVDRSKATTRVCEVPTNPVGTDGSTLPDTGLPPTDSSVTDTTPADSSTDADTGSPADAADEGG